MICTVQFKISLFHLNDWVIVYYPFSHFFYIKKATNDLVVKTETFADFRLAPPLPPKKQNKLKSKQGLLTSVHEVLNSIFSGRVMRRSRNFRQGDPGQSDKKALTTFFFFFSPQLILQKSNGQFQRNLSFSRFQRGSNFSRGGPTFSRGGPIAYSP